MSVKISELEELVQKQQQQQVRSLYSPAITTFPSHRHIALCVPRVLLPHNQQSLHVCFLQQGAPSDGGASSAGGGALDGTPLAAVETRLGEYGRVLQAMRNRIVALQVRMQH